jgi:hypothetical protein
MTDPMPNLSIFCSSNDGVSSIVGGNWESLFTKDCNYRGVPKVVQSGE